MIEAKDLPSTRPYLVRALYEWCTDNGLTPYVAVLVDDSVRVPMEYVKDGEIVLNISFDATSSLKLGNEYIEFKARFAGSAREIMVPLSRVIAIYARENGQGMAFPLVGRAAEPVRAHMPPVLSAVKSAPLVEDSKVVHLNAMVSDQSSHSINQPEPSEPPEPPVPPASPAGAGSGTGRPALKRIK